MFSTKKGQSFIVRVGDGALSNNGVVACNTVKCLDADGSSTLVVNGSNNVIYDNNLDNPVRETTGKQVLPWWLLQYMSSKNNEHDKFSLSNNSDYNLAIGHTGSCILHLLTDRGGEAALILINTGGSINVTGSGSYWTSDPNDATGKILVSKPTASGSIINFQNNTGSNINIWYKMISYLDI